MTIAPTRGCSRTRGGGRWGVYHGLRPKHPQAYLDEVVFRFNRRCTLYAALGRLLELSVALQPATYQILVSRS